MNDVRNFPQPERRSVDEFGRVIGQLEAQVKQLERTVDSMASDVTAIRKTLDEARGGGRVVLWLVGIVGGGIGAVVVKVFSNIPHS